MKTFAQMFLFWQNTCALISCGFVCQTQKYDTQKTHNVLVVVAGLADRHRISIAVHQDPAEQSRKRQHRVRIVVRPHALVTITMPLFLKSSCYYTVSFSDGHRLWLAFRLSQVKCRVGSNTGTVIKSVCRNSRTNECATKDWTNKRLTVLRRHKQNNYSNGMENHEALLMFFHTWR